MATYTDRRQIKHRRQIQRRFDNDHKRLALLISMILLRFARIDSTGKRVIPTDNRTRLLIKAAIWAEVLKPYYIGHSEPFNGPTPQSPFAQLLYDGIEGATRIQVERQVSLLKQYVKDAVILAWLTTLGLSQSQRQGLPVVNVLKRVQEPFYAWADSNGYKLNDRIQRNAIDVRTKIDRMIDYHIGEGTDAALIASTMDNFITISGRSTGKAYGEYGAYAAWLLVRGAMLVAAGAATIVTSTINPYVDYVQWRLSMAHKDADECDDNARGGRNGDGVYLVGNAPRYPNHPNCVLPGQPVATTRGNVSIERINDSDFVLTHKGRYKSVLQSWCSDYAGPVYKIKTDHSTFELTANHPVLTRRGWVNAGSLQLGDQVLYTSVDISPNVFAGVTNGFPSKFSESGVSLDVVSRLSSVPSTAIALDNNPVFNKGEVSDIIQDSELFFKDNAMKLESVGHDDFDIRWPLMKQEATKRAEHLKSVTILDPKRVLALLADNVNTVLHREPFSIFFEKLKPWVANLFGLRDFFANFWASGYGIVSISSMYAHGFLYEAASKFTSRPIVLLPRITNGLTAVPDFQFANNHEGFEHARCDAKLPTYLNRKNALLDIEREQNVFQGLSGLGFDSQAMPFSNADVVSFGVPGTRGFEDALADGASKIELHNSLLSLSPDLAVGAESGISVVNGVITPVQALTNYSTIIEVRQRYYSGKVYNMHVEGDNSYTVNGACVHNCACSLVPLGTANANEVTQRLRDDIQANNAEAQRVRGALNVGRIVGALMNEGAKETS